ncbi:hypothetical protein WAI453_003152 [Rhynchosporium graminicola]
MSDPIEEVPMSSPNSLLFIPRTPHVRLETIRHLHNDAQSLVLDTLFLRKRTNVHHRSRAFYVDLHSAETFLDESHPLGGFYYRSKDETVLGLKTLQ